MLEYTQHKHMVDLNAALDQAKQARQDAIDEFVGPLYDGIEYDGIEYPTRADQREAYIDRVGEKNIDQFMHAIETENDAYLLGFIDILDPDTSTEIDEASDSIREAQGAIDDFENEFNANVRPQLAWLDELETVNVESVKTSFSSISTYVSFTYSGTSDQAADELSEYEDLDEALDQLLAGEVVRLRLSDHEPNEGITETGRIYRRSSGDLNYIF